MGSNINKTVAQLVTMAATPGAPTDAEIEQSECVVQSVAEDLVKDKLKVDECKQELKKREASRPASAGATTPEDPRLRILVKSSPEVTSAVPQEIEKLRRLRRGLRLRRTMLIPTL